MKGIARFFPVRNTSAMRTGIPILVAAVLVGACGVADAPETARQIDIRDAVALRALPSATLHPDAPLCADDRHCPVPAQPAAVVGDDGEVVFLMASGRRAEVGRVRAGGDSASRIGREGSGPGEYLIPALLGLSSTGEALVFDIASRRTLRFARDGAVISTALVTLPPAPLGGFGFVDRELRILSTDAPKVAGDSLPVHVFAVDSGGSAARRLITIDLRQPAHGLRELRPPPGLFAPADLFALRVDGVVAFAHGAQMALTLFDSAGRFVRQSAFSLEPRGPNAAEVTEARSLRLRGFPPGPMRDAAERQMTQSAAARMPLVTRLVAMRDGEMWMRGTPSAEDETVEWIVFARDGEPLRRVSTSVDDSVLGKHGKRYLVARAEPEGSRYWWMTLR